MKIRGETINKKLGVLGGLGPFATEYFFKLILDMTDGDKDQDHIEMVIYNKPSIPDRTSYVLGKSNDNPVCSMIDAGQALDRLLVDYTVIPCITGHYFYNEISSKLKAEIIHPIKETAIYLKERGFKTVGVMATEGTVESNLFQNHLQDYGIKAVLPDSKEQDLVSHIIYENVKANLPVDMNKFNIVANDLRNQGAEVIILACSELSIIKNNYPIGSDFIDAMEVLARRCITLCGGNLKKEYKELIK